ncbi:MAG: hypothetical protein ACXW4Q_11260 [Anaerolineales bacterium]
MLIAYQVMPVSELFSVQRVNLHVPLSMILAQSAMKAVCEMCNEEIINGREVVKREMILYRLVGGSNLPGPAF